MKRHRTDLLSMFSGLVFLGLGGVFVTGRVDVTDLGAQWLWPMPLILGGLFIFFAAFRSEPETAAEAPVDEPAGEMRAEAPIDEPADGMRAENAVTGEPLEATGQEAEPPEDSD